MFSKKGIISFETGDEDAIMEAALEAGAEDVVTNEDGSIDILTTPEDFEAVENAIREAGLEPGNAEITFSSETMAELGEDDAEKLLRMVDALEDLDDVQEVYTNADIAAEIYEKLD
jgi:transcriptional/translational regulatory protein YebC/TACO1